MVLGLALAASLTLPTCLVDEVRATSAKCCPGRICPVAEVVVRPQVTGEILEVGFANGETVEKGRVLYRLDPVQYQAAVKNAEAKVAELKARLEYAELTVTRHTELVKTRAVSQDDLDNSRATRDAARASLAAAEAALLAARDDLNHCTIKAPIAGKLGSTARTEGNYVQKGDAGLVTLVQIDPVRGYRARCAGNAHATCVKPRQTRELAAAWTMEISPLRIVVRLLFE